MKHIIVICGERGVGKDYLVNAAIQELSESLIKRTSFSDEVRRIAYASFPFLKNIPSENKNDPWDKNPEENPTSKSWRDIIKMIGAVHREVDTAYFAKAWKNNQFSNSNEHLFITDMRTQDEYDLLCKLDESDSNLTVNFIKLVADTGLPSDDFEEWVRTFDPISKRGKNAWLFRNDYDIKSTIEFIKLINEILVDTIVPFTPQSLMPFLKKQVLVNEAYSEDWKDISELKYATAASVEFVEFLNEIQKLWAWWKSDAVFNKDKAIVELCDHICFVFSYIHIISCGVIPENINGWFNASRFQSFTKPLDYDSFIAEVEYAIGCRYSGGVYGIQEIHRLIVNVAIFLEVTPNDILDVLKQVQERNMVRGKLISEGKDVDKSSEAEIKI